MDTEKNVAIAGPLAKEGHADAGGSPASDLGRTEELYHDAKTSSRITRKIDIHLVPVLGLMYLIAFLDRTNIANAKLNGLEKELHMPSNGYNTALWIFFLPFVVFEVPSNVVLGWHKIKPNQWMGAIVFFLGNVNFSDTVYRL